MRYEVTITEVLRRVVIVEADNRREAEEIAQEHWNDEEYILDAGDFEEVDFDANAREVEEDGKR